MPFVIIGLILLATFVAAVLLAPKPDIENAKAAKLGDFRFPRADEGDPVPLIYGTVRLRSPNTIWYGDYKAVAIKEKVKTGIFSSKTITKGYKYYLGLNLALCLGPGVVLRKIWAGKETAWTGTQGTDGIIIIDKPDLFGGEEKRGGLKGSLEFFTGSFTQDVSGYLASKVGGTAPRYGGICHIVFNQFYFGTTPNLEPLHFELQRLSDNLVPGKGIMPNGKDMNPIEVLYDLMTGTWGRMGLTPSMLDLPSFQAACTTCYNEGLGMSIIVQAANNAADVIQEILRLVDGLMYQDPVTGKVVMKLVRKDYTVGTLPVFDQSIIRDVRNLAKSTWEATFNQVRVTFTHRDKRLTMISDKKGPGYSDGVAIAQDVANISFQGRVKTSNLNMPMIHTADVAQKVAARALARLTVPLYKCELYCSRQAGNYRPGDVFKFTWAPFGISDLVMRISRIDLGDLTSGMVRILAVQDEFATETTKFAAPESAAWTPPDKEPALITHKKVFEAPYFFVAKSGLEVQEDQSGIYAVAKPPGDNSVAFSAIASTDAWATEVWGLDTVLYVGCGVLATAMTATDGVAEGVVTSITMNTVSSEFLSNNADLNAIRDGHTLFIIGNEIFAYVGHVDNGDGTHTFSTIYRGLLDTAPEAHAIGDYVYFLVGQEGLLDALFQDTATVNVKLLDVTTQGTMNKDLVTSDIVTLNQRYDRPMPPDYLTINGSRTPLAVETGSTLLVQWNERSRLTTNTSGDLALRVYNDGSDLPEPGTDYRVRSRVNGGAWTEHGYTIQPTAFITVPTAGAVEVEVFARRNGLLSLVGDTCAVTVQVGAPPPVPTGQQYYVSTTGLDTNDGMTTGTPWRTIQKAMNAATPGSTVNIRAGTYQEAALVLRVSGNETDGYITFQPYGYTGTRGSGEAVILDYAFMGVVSTDAGKTPRLLISSRQYVKIKGIKLQNFTNQGAMKQGIRVDGTSSYIELDGLTMKDMKSTSPHDGSSAYLNLRIWGPSHHVTVKNCEFDTCLTNYSEVCTTDRGAHDCLIENNWFHDCDGICTDANGQSYNITIRGNLYEFNNRKRDNSTYYNDASVTVYCDGSHDVIIENNTFRDLEWAVWVASEPGEPDAYNVTIRNNTIERCYLGIGGGNYYDGVNTRVRSIRVYNNTIYDGRSGVSGGNVGVQFVTCSDIQVRNNIFVDLSSGFKQTAVSGMSIDYNLYHLVTGSVGPDANKVLADPLFTNAGTGDLTLQAGSPAINAGDPATSTTYSGTTDKAGNTRIQGGRIDIGAYEKA